MNAFERRLKARLQTEIPDLKTVTPGIVIDVHLNGRRKGRLEVGRTYDFYDLASLTKIIFTASACMHHFDRHRGDLSAPLTRYLSWGKKKISPRQLMTHTAGLEWWIPAYKSLRGPMRPDARWAQMIEILKKVKTVRRAKAVYSDIDLWMLGAYMCEATDKTLLELWAATQDRLGVKKLWFQPGNRPLYKRARYAPTERCSWRHKVLQGEVHDDNTWALAGVAPHAGLFGTAEGVSEWGLELRKAILDRSKRFGDPRLVRQFVKRQIPPKIGDFGWLFMKPTKGKASCGRYFHPSSFGHTGFTGTSFWMDPKKDLMVTIMSNRIHPTRENKEFVALRPRLHDWICESLD